MTAVTGRAPGNPLIGWRVPRDDIRYIGTGLRRPECVLATPDGTILAADAGGGVVRIRPGGVQDYIGPNEPPSAAATDDDFNVGGSLPNGIALLPDGSILIANIGSGAIERLTADGRVTRLFDRLDGRPLGLVNFVTTDSRGQVWFTVTTRLDPWDRASNERPADGYVARIDDDGITVMADGFTGTNEIRFGPGEEWLYVVESNARHVSRLRLRRGRTPRLSDREIVGPDDLGGIPDGFAFDVAGNLWITLVSADRLVALTPDGQLLTLLDDGDPDGIAEFERHFTARTLTPPVIAGTRGTIAPLMSSVTFGGPDLRTVYLGSLMGTRLPVFRSPVAGLPLPHWT
ncbi:MAG TPA: SMP-30/gluconolactonase/LRE family protein [Streptosporangiaceae bacterium]